MPREKEARQVASHLFERIELLWQLAQGVGKRQEAALARQPEGLQVIHGEGRQTLHAPRIRLAQRSLQAAERQRVTAMSSDALRRIATLTSAASSQELLRVFGRSKKWAGALQRERRDRGREDGRGHRIVPRETAMQVRGHERVATAGRVDRLRHGNRGNVIEPPFAEHERTVAAEGDKYLAWPELGQTPRRQADVPLSAQQQRLAGVHFQRG